MKPIVVSTSGGLGSGIALIRCVEKYGPENVHAVFADTKSEDEDLYRYLDDLERHTGVEITRLSDGRDIWDVFDEHNMIVVQLPAGNACKASVELKIKPLAKWVAERFPFDDETEPECIVATGIDWTEPERAERMGARWAPYECVHPCFWEPRLSWCQQQSYMRGIGIEPPRLYERGFAHNNCSGCCVLGGLKQWAGALKHFPETFAYHERREAAFMERNGFSVLRDRRGGETQPYPLSRLRADIEAGRADLDDGLRSSCGCVEVQGTFWELLDERAECFVGAPERASTEEGESDG